MLAKQLSTLLHRLLQTSDVTSDSADDMDERFESLRAYGRLPAGKENRSRALTNEQIIASLLGLVTPRPGWAGHVAAVLGNLKPVGGQDDAFCGAATFTEAMSHILSDVAARNSTLSVQISGAEAGTNSHGFAVITYQADEGRRRQAYVRDEAVSLLQPGAVYDSELRNAPISRELVFNRRFFDELVRGVDYTRAHPTPVIGDGAEYDREETERARRLELGATPASRYLNIGVDNQVTWPNKETLIEFDRYKLVMMPKTAENVQSVHIDLYANRLTTEEAMTVINRFLSLLTWCDDQFAIAQGGWGGNPVPVPVPRRNLAFSTASQWLFNRNIPQSDEVKRALALYREARNAQQNFMISYAVLNYYKIIEIRHPGFPASSKWVADNLPAVLADSRYKDDSKRFLAACGQEAPEIYVYAACRVAVAHVSPNRPSDPDDFDEIRRLHNAADVMHRLARQFILSDLGFSDNHW